MKALMSRALIILSVVLLYSVSAKAAHYHHVHPDPEKSFGIFAGAGVMDTNRGIEKKRDGVVGGAEYVYNNVSVSLWYQKYNIPKAERLARDPKRGKDIEFTTLALRYRFPLGPIFIPIGFGVSQINEVYTLYDISIHAGAGLNFTLGSLDVDLVLGNGWFSQSRDRLTKKYPRRNTYLYLGVRRNL